MVDGVLTVFKTIKTKGSVFMFNIPSEGWIALCIWFAVFIIPWVYSAVLIKKINDSKVERWGAKNPKKISTEETIPVEREVKV